MSQQEVFKKLMERRAEAKANRDAQPSQRDVQKAVKAITAPRRNRI